jgi:hypothetical protein
MMLRWILGAWLVLSNTLYAESEKTVVAFLGEDISEINFSEAKIAMKLWIDEVSTSNDINAEIMFFKTFDAFYEAYLTQKVESVFLSPYTYLKYSDQIDRHFYYGWSKLFNASSKNTRYYLVASQKADANKKVKSIALFKDDHLAKMIADTMILNHTLLHKDKNFEFDLIQKESKVLLTTFFNKNDYCIVREEIWNIALDLNPQVGKHLKIIAKTEKIFFSLISLISNEMPPQLREAYLQTIKNLDKTKTGRQLMRLFRFRGVQPITTEDLKPLKDYYRNYLRLKELSI